MAPRTPPSNEHITNALLDAHSGRLRMNRTALSWNEAEDFVRRVFKTNRDKAYDWLLAAVSASDSLIIGVQPHTGTLLSELDPPLTLSHFGWTDQNVRDLCFDQHGRLILPGARTSPVRGIFANLIHRDQLEPIRTVLAAQRAKIERERIEAKAAELAEFRALHGDALDVIQSVMDRVPAKNYLREDMVSARMLSDKTALHQELYGGDAVLTLTLHAGQIDALAALLRHIPAED